MNTSTTIARHTPMLEIDTYGGERYYLEAAKENALLSALETQKFVLLAGVTLACREIKSVKPATARYDVASVPPEYRSRIEARSKRYREAIDVDPDSRTIAKWVARLQNGESI